MSFLPALQGFFLGISMISAIGAQNAWVLKQGISRNHHIAVATTCAICDVALIFLGVYGAATLIEESQLLLSVITIAGVLFLGWYGAQSLRSALSPVGSLDIPQSGSSGLLKVVGGTLALTLLNPHVYLDTVVVLGSVGGQYQGMERLAYAVGTVTASTLWFYSLALGAAKLAPVLSRAKVRKGIDLMICVIMWVIAGLLLSQWLSKIGLL